MLKKGDRAGLGRLIDVGGLTHVRGQFLHEERQGLRLQRRVTGEPVVQVEGHHQHELAVRSLRQHRVDEVGGSAAGGAALICREREFDSIWKDGGKLALVNTQPATRAHPETGEQIWFNHSQVLHLSAASGECRRAGKRQRPLQSRTLAPLTDAPVRLKRLTSHPEDQAMHCTYGDSSEIPFEDMEKERNAICVNMVAFRCEPGDVVATDNFPVSHGRLPYRGSRTMTVCRAWSAYAGVGYGS